MNGNYPPPISYILQRLESDEGKLEFEKWKAEQEKKKAGDASGKFIV